MLSSLAFASSISWASNGVFASDASDQFCQVVHPSNKWECSWRNETSSKTLSERSEMAMNSSDSS